MLDRIAEFFIFGFAPLVVGMLATPDFSMAAEQTLTGEATYRERIALPPNAVLTVQLADVSLADAPAAMVAEREFRPAGQVPVKFELKFDSSAIQPKMTYALQARITVDDKLMFINDERLQVDPLTAGPQKIMLKMVKN
ncbi:MULTISPECIES: YbaY family lipoprotein [unclassified Mesorhizobium]|uniref:YbaY family lipoprotein n=1 Tax=unclassified Mesorhizobium TaxID=325217 RepID=UPI0009E9DFE5|nr:MULTISPECIES: YbaY family lipoprotein [unclassified Mesorhizobium]